MNLVQFCQRPEGFAAHKAAAAEAFKLYRDHCNGDVPPRVPGCDTIIRLAWRIYHGKSAVEAAASEYVYRMRLAIKAPDQVLDATCRNPAVSIFGTPHAIGM